MVLLICIIIILIMLCGAVVSTKAVSGRNKNDSTDAVYRDNYRYRNQYREEKEDCIKVDLPDEEEQIEEPTVPQTTDELDEKQEAEQQPVIAPGEDIKK